MIKKLPFAFLFLISSLSAQNIEFSGDVNFQGIISSEEESPFWFYSNKRGRIDETTSFAGWATASGRYYLTENAFLEVGAGLLFQDGYTDKLQLDESYVSFQNSWLMTHIGRKQRKELYKGISASNVSILWSLNARPMPGISLSTSRPIMFWRKAGLGFEAAYEEFLMDDERFVENTRVHHKSFHLVFSKIRNVELSFGVQHFVQWGGISPEFGQLPKGFDDYIRIVTGKGIGNNAGEDITDQEINALGNHIGSYEVHLKTHYKNYEIQLFWNHLFEDGSGMDLGNTPDGRYGLYISDSEEDKIINGFMYEFYFTKNQSEGSLTTDGTDNYFNNNLYRSGWTYESKVLGAPFFTLNENRFRIANNRFIVHHLGISGIAFQNTPYKLLTSYRKNYGGKGAAYPETQNILSSYLDVLVWQSYFNLNVQLGSGFSSTASPNYGLGVRLSKSLF